MRFAIAIALVLSSSSGLVQVSLAQVNLAQVNLSQVNQMNAPAAGAAQPSTSMIDSTAAPAPSGENAAQAALGGAGVPLGTTELFGGGLSPATTDTGAACPGISFPSGVGPLGTGAVFSGDGTLATSPSDMAGGSGAADGGCGTTASAAVGPLAPASSTGAAAAFAGGNIPLGATGPSSAGLGGGISLAAPASTTIGGAVGAPACGATAVSTGAC